MRLFIAIELPEEIRRSLAKIQRAVESLIVAKWGWDDPKSVRPDQMHLTLKFLGDTRDDVLTLLIDQLKVVQTEPIQLAIKGVVAFPERGPIRVVAAELVDCQGRCAELQRRVDEACHESGFRLEGRRWIPHVTVCRIKEFLPGTLRDGFAKHAVTQEFFTVSGFSLIESRLSQAGPDYVTVARFSGGC
jgi:2'-5' RNA ligase